MKTRSLVLGLYIFIGAVWGASVSQSGPSGQLCPWQDAFGPERRNPSRGEGQSPVITLWESFPAKA